MFLTLNIEASEETNRVVGGWEETGRERFRYRWR